MKSEKITYLKIGLENEECEILYKAADIARKLHNLIAENEKECLCYFDWNDFESYYDADDVYTLADNIENLARVTKIE